ncbi:hypothetical protein EPA93_07725 [Ktedonosporobacter rubrisoli]|uniref:Peptidase domain-containing ABC transporter n=1 Tax=Ktedonosporobacter rubrisoli TaxID=2509675 RepID=A0A4P6JLF1_KTERU|nr:cysteine peptidase family C39 domain-containing protein [Ktedonosporobacter rubrisoli]QBD75903.1 hypothetical protein EPA93_07725 [Ktedonosporobacter rubrisoli]
MKQSQAQNGSPQPEGSRLRMAALSGLGPIAHDSSPVVADVIEHREQAVRRHTTGLEPLAEPSPAKKKPKGAASPAPKRGTNAGCLRSQFRRRVPAMLQMSEVECGAACLAMILRYYGRKTSISEISERYGVGRDGLSALNIVDAARDYGLRVRAVSLKDNNFRFVSLPAIIHWQFNHFIIVERWTPNNVDVVDPAMGHRRLSGEEFDQGFTGVVIMLEPGTQFVRHTGAPQVSLYTYVLQYIKRAPIILAQIVLASLLLQLFGLAVPLLTKVVVDKIIPFRALDILPLLGSGLLLVLLAQLIIMLLRASLLVYLQARIDSHIMPAFLEHMLTLPPHFFQKRSSGDILSRLNSNTIVRDMISNQLVSAFLDGSLVIVYLIILLSQSMIFGGFVFAIGLVQVVLLLATNGLMRTLTRRELEATGKTQGYVNELLTGMTTLKAMGAEQRAYGHWSNLFFNQLNSSIRRGYFSSVVNTFMLTLQTLSPLVLLWVGAIQVVQGKMDEGTMLALNALAASFLAPLASLVSSGQQLQIVSSHLERIADILDAQPEQDVQRVQKPPRLSGRIRLEHVGFQYE